MKSTDSVLNAEIRSFAIFQVHHVDPTCQDAGVVYSKLQGRDEYIKRFDVAPVSSCYFKFIDVSFTDGIPH